MFKHLLLATALIANPVLAQQVYTSPVELIDSSPKTDGLVISKAKLAPPVPKGTAVRPCGKKDNFWTYVKLADKCPAPPLETIDGKSSKADTLYGRNGVVTLDKCRPLQALGPYRVVETYSKDTYKNITCSGLVSENIKREGIRLRGPLENIVIENFRLIHEDKLNESPHLPEGIHVESGKNITIRNGEAGGYRMVSSSYTNGDAFATERGVNGIRFENTLGRDSSDGCYDLKSVNTEMINTTAARCNRNYRFWGTGTGYLMTSIDANKWHVGIYSTQFNWHIKKLVVRSTTKAAIFHSESKGPGTSLIVDECDIQVPVGTKLFEGSKPETLILGPTCVVPTK